MPVKRTEISPVLEISDALSDWIDLIKHPKTFDTAIACLVHISNAFGAARCKAKAEVRQIPKERADSRALAMTGGVIKVIGRRCYQVDIAPDNDPEADIHEWITSEDCIRYSHHLAELINSYDDRVTPTTRCAAPDFEGLLVGVAAMMKEKKRPWSFTSRQERTSKMIERLGSKFYIARENGALEGGIGQLLLNAVVFFDKSFRQGTHSPLHEATKAQDLDAIIMLLSHEIHVNSKDEEGHTALFHAITLDFPFIAKTLILFGADHGLVRIGGKSVQHICEHFFDNNFPRPISTAMFNVLRIAATRAKDKTYLKYEYWAKFARAGKEDCQRTHLLSLDGGGIRGLVLTTVLDEIARKVPNFLEKCTWTAGTSTGSILAMALAQGKSIFQCRNMYFKFKILEEFLSKTYGVGSDGKPLTMLELGEKCQKKVIATSVDRSGKALRTVLFKTYKVKERYEPTLANLTRQRARSEGKDDNEKEMKKKSEKITRKEKKENMKKKDTEEMHIRDDRSEISVEIVDDRYSFTETLEDLIKDKSVCATEASEFENCSILDPNPMTTTVADAARASSAAPMYFHSPDNTNYIDGGILNNNPTMVLLNEWMLYNEAEKDRRDELLHVNTATKIRRFLDANKHRYEDNMSIWGFGECSRYESHLRSAAGRSEQEKELVLKKREELGAVISIGTGQVKDDMPRDPTNSRAKECFHDIKESFRIAIAKSDGQIVEQAYAFTRSHGGAFFRFQPQMDEKIELNETDNVTLIEMMWTANKYMRKQIRYIETLYDIMNPHDEEQ